MDLRAFGSLSFFMMASLFLSGMTKVVAHRGYWDTEGSAQNSIRSLVKADSIGCHASEFDVWITADDVLVVNHDADIEGHVIETETSDILSRCHLSNGETLPSLEHYLDVAGTLSVDLVLELKPHKDPSRENLAVEKIVSMIAEKGLQDRVTYITFSRNAFDRFVSKGGRPVFYLGGMSPDVLAEMGGAGPDYHVNVFRKNPDWISRFKSMGMPVNVWTVSLEKDLRWCIDREVEFVTTNAPELALKLVREAAEPVDLRVMTYNLRFGEHATVDELAEEIGRYSPDFVALQEVDVMTNRNLSPHQNGHDMLTELAAKTGMMGLYARTINFAGGYYGIGILSRHPCERSERVYLPDPADVEARVLLKGVFEIGGHRKIMFACTHLDYKDASTRRLQADYLLDDLSDVDIPIIIGGDFNALPEEDAISSMGEKMSDLTDSRPTFPAEDPTDKIDYLFGFPKEKFSVVSTMVPDMPSKPLSDHRPVISDISVDMDR